MKNNIIIKYRVDIGSKLFFFFLTLFYLLGIILTFNDFTLFIKILFIIIFISLLYGFLWFLGYTVAITESSLIIEFLIFPFRVKSQEVDFNKISRVRDLGFLFDDHIVLFYYGSPNKKTAFIPVGLGFPWEILNDILARLPASTQVDFDPYLLKKLKNLKPVSAKKLILLAVFLTLLVLFAGWYFWPE